MTADRIDADASPQSPSRTLSGAAMERALTTRLAEQMTGTTSLLELATRLGRECLESGGALHAGAAELENKPFIRDVESRIAALEPAVWIDAAAAGSAAALIEASELRKAVRRLEMQPPLEQLAVLRGLCTRALPNYYLITEEQIVLDRGTPVPIVSRPVHKLFRATPHPAETLNAGHPLDGLAHKLFEFAGAGSARVVLDYSHRDRLDEITWTGTGRLPLIGTLHPFLGAQAIEIGEETRSTFFGVKPKRWDRNAILSQLRTLAQAPIAVLPELCLPIVDALEDALAEDPDAYPALIVAGSAHVSEPAEEGRKAIRANECRIYLDGKRVASHRKIRPFRLRSRHIGGHDITAREEGITREVKTITVLSGEHTRMAVVICADLNDESIPGLLEGAGVNLLLVPAMTNGAGAFMGALCGLASRCQALGVVVNAGLDPRAQDEDPAAPFLAMASVPRPADQFREYRERGGRETVLGIIDPNRPLAEAMKWLP